jgi:hypothetical protein
MKDDIMLDRLADKYSWNETVLFLNARVRQLKVEKGQQAAFIQELEDRLKAALLELEMLKSGEGMELARKQKQQALLDDRVKNLMTGNNTLKETNKRLRESNAKLIAELNFIKTRNP